jgi:hypothetical protein
MHATNLNIGLMSCERVRASHTGVTLECVNLILEGYEPGRAGIMAAQHDSQVRRD